MRFILPLISLMCIHQATFADGRFKASAERVAQIEVFKTIISLSAGNSNHTNKSFVDSQDVAAVIQELIVCAQNKDSDMATFFTHSVYAMAREKGAKVANENTNKLIQAIYLRALEKSEGKEFSAAEIAEELKMKRFSEKTNQLFSVAGYVSDLVIQETTRCIIDFLANKMSTVLKTKNPGQPKP